MFAHAIRRVAISKYERKREREERRGGRYRETGGEGWMKGDEGREKLKGNSFRYLPDSGKNPGAQSAPGK